MSTTFLASDKVSLRPTPSQVDRWQQLRRVLRWGFVLLFAKGLLGILAEYRWYFPADFDQGAFLIGRKEYFFGLYSYAFYAHIIASPIAIVLGSYLMVSGTKKSKQKSHRRVGRLQILIVLLAVVPTGILMAMKARTGAVAGWGFAFHSIATGLCAVMAIVTAVRRRFSDHRRWASRCFLLLCTPLLLRVFSGITIVTGTESVLTYQLNAWLSWSVPMLVYEFWWRFRVADSSSFFQSFHGELPR